MESVYVGMRVCPRVLGGLATPGLAGGFVLVMISRIDASWLAGWRSNKKEGAKTEMTDTIQERSP